MGWRCPVESADYADCVVAVDWSRAGRYERSAKKWIRPPSSFRRRPESSGVNETFPHSGNDNHRNDNRTRHPPKPATPAPPGLSSWIPAFAGMTTEGGMGLSPSRSPFAISGKLSDINLRHSGAGRNPVVLTSHSRSAGMTMHRHDNRTRHPANPAIPAPPRPPFLDSSLRWNDDGGGMGLSPSRQPLCHSQKNPNPSPLRHLWTGRPVCGERARL